jgi:hypothetical protein
MSFQNLQCTYSGTRAYVAHVTEPDESEVPEPVETTAASAPPATADQQFKEFKL